MGRTMRLFQRGAVGLATAIAVIAAINFAQQPSGTLAQQSNQAKSVITPKIAWYGQLKDGLAEAKRSNRPIFLVSAAPQCEAVPGIW